MNLIHKGSIWRCIDKDSDLFGKLCIVKYIDNNPDLNGSSDISLLYSDGTRYEGKAFRFSPGYTHELRRGAKTTQRNPWMKDIRVKVYLKEELVYQCDVRSKDRGRAITNVLTNIYRGDVDDVKATIIE